MELERAKGQFLNAQLKLGTVGKVSSPGCKPASVVEVSPHAPTVVKAGDTIDVKLCGSASN